MIRGEINFFPKVCCDFWWPLGSNQSSTHHHHNDFIPSPLTCQLDGSKKNHDYDIFATFHVKNIKMLNFWRIAIQSKKGHRLHDQSSNSHKNDIWNCTCVNCEWTDLILIGLIWSGPPFYNFLLEKKEKKILRQKNLGRLIGFNLLFERMKWFMSSQAKSSQKAEGRTLQEQ